MGRVIVVGSINQDITVTVDRFPQPGETLSGTSTTYRLGGKGANQAAAAAHGGATTLLVGRVGGDPAGITLREELRAHGVDVSALRTDEEITTGIAFITVSSAGENTIILDAGANGRVTGEQAAAAVELTADDVVVLQGEIPPTANETVIAWTHAAGARVVLNPAPVYPIPPQTLADVDVIAFCLPANERIGPGDRYIARDLAGLRAPVVAVVTKTDTVSRQALAAQLLAVDALGDWADIVPVSAVRGEQVGVLTDVLVSHLPPSPPLYPTGEVTDEPVEVMVAELVREAALEGVRDELPHSLAVVVDEIVDPRSARERGSRVKGSGNRLQVRVSLVVERDSQKAIVIGRGGARLKEVGVRARAGIERLLGRRVYLDLHVRTARDWQSDPRALARLGF